MKHPSDGNALLHLARIATLERRTAEVVSLVNRALALKPERDANLELLGLRAAATANAVQRRGLLDTIRADARLGGTGDEARLLAWRVATYSDSPDDGTEIIAALTHEHNGMHTQLLSHSALAHMNAASGHFAAAKRELDIVEHIDARFAAETRANFALAWPAFLGVAERARVMDVLMQSLANGTANRTRGNWSDLDSMSRARGHYLYGTLALAAGDTVLARSQQRILVALGTENNADADLAQHLEYELSARILWRIGNASEALRQVEAGWPKGSPRAALPFFQGDVYTQAHERYLRGQLLVAVGRTAEAERWFRAVADDQGASLILSKSVHLALAAIAEKRGAESVAITNYQRAIALSADADGDVLTAMRGAEVKLQALIGRQSHAVMARALTGDSPE